VKRIGFIGEGDSEVVLFTSISFKDLLFEYNLESVGEINAEGRGKFERFSTQLESKVKILLERKPEKIFIISDLENEACISHYKSIIIKYSNIQIEVIAVKTIEAWLLADSETLAVLLKGRFHFDFPEKTQELPLYILQKNFMDRIGKGLGNSKPKIMKKFIKNGFGVDRAAKHTNCPSAKYFLKKLKEFSEE